MCSDVIPSRHAFMLLDMYKIIANFIALCSFPSLIVLVYASTGLCSSFPLLVPVASFYMFFLRAFSPSSVHLFHSPLLYYSHLFFSCFSVPLTAFLQVPTCSSSSFLLLLFLTCAHYSSVPIGDDLLVWVAECHHE